MKRAILGLLKLCLMAACCRTDSNYLLMDKLPDLISRSSYSKLAAAEYKRSPGMLLIDMGLAEGLYELFNLMLIA